MGAPEIIQLASAIGIPGAAVVYLINQMVKAKSEKPDKPKDEVIEAITDLKNAVQHLTEAVNGNTEKLTFMQGQLSNRR